MPSEDYTRIMSDQSEVRYTRVPIDFPDFKEIDAVAQHWRSVKGDRLAPKWSDIDLLAMPSDLIFRICVVDVKQDPLDFVYRFWGTDITDMHKYDLTGKSIQNLTPPSYADCLMEQYRCVQENAEPCGYLTEIPLDAGFYTYYAVIRLPLSSDGKTIDGVLSAEEYGEQKDELKNLFERVWRDQQAT